MTRREDLLTVDEAATYLGVQRRWLMRSGVNGPPRVVFNRTDIRYAQADLDAWIESRREKIECPSIGGATVGGGNQMQPVQPASGRLSSRATW